MSSLQADFSELLRRVEAGREFAHASFEPIFYLVFDPRDILEVKRQTLAWLARLKNEGWDVHTFSIADQIADILGAAPMRKVWLAGDRKAPLDWNRTNGALANALTSQGQLQSRLEALLAGLEGKTNTIVLVTDLEALHPYLRIGAIEAQLQGKFHVPTVFLYPGTRTGKTQLRFLGFYPEDGNYRSVHVGG
ncbi:BREX protein BrxB domain-containing protein [Roseomonas genomospecies 6]|uniref:DUF1788 domain-containing protein n=1 Tax=Roseomonas genomospecies 6 TaxID=214106 RepID=A0A9W7KPR2_9PROT|nr:BREX protein BrxB domain-containing protein [Roseomonas genomospecies 6]KAA0676973.1 DUF1788 domain-containing protein [Roseomonas genomospecies 6]